MTRTKYFLTALLLGGCVSVAMPTAAQANALEQNAATVSDFMTDLPPSNDGGQLSDFFQGPFYYGKRRLLADYRFYNKKRQAGRKVEEIAEDAEAAFTEECSAKGGYIEPRSNAAMYNDTTSRLGLRGSNSPARAICMTSSGEALGMFTAWRVTTYDYRFVILAILPEAVVTQRVREADAAREQAESDARMARIVAEMEREANWRRSIQPGDESNCGPVVQVNGDMIQVISRQTRDERWYRRSELSPEFYPDGSRYYCR